MTTRKPSRTQVSQRRAVGRLKRGLLRRELEQAEREIIVRVLREMAGNVTNAAKHLGISRRGLWFRMEALAIEPDKYRT